MASNPETLAPIDPQAATWHNAVLFGPYLKRRRCRVLVDSHGLIVDSDIIHSAWSNTVRFDQAFRRDYHPLIVSEPVT